MTTPSSGAPGTGGGAVPRVALDLLGGDLGPEVVVDAALLAADPAAPARCPVELVLVGPADLAEALLSARGAAGRFAVVPAAAAVAMDEDPVGAVRTRPDCSIRVATDLLHAGRVDATVSVGHTGAALAAATFGLDRLRGVTRPAVAVVVPTLDGEVVLLDAGGTPDANADLLAQFALAGSAYARARGTAQPRVGLLTIGTEAGKGDELRRAAAALLEHLPVRYVGGVEGGALARGGVADVVVTDGFTGNVVLKAIEGAAEASLERAAGAYPDPRPAQDVARRLRAGAHAGALLLGVDGVCVVGHGASTAEEVVAYVALAARAVTELLIPRHRGVPRRARAGAPRARARAARPDRRGRPMTGTGSGAALGPEVLTQLAGRLGVDIAPAMLEHALMHRSFAYENGGLPTNERLSSSATPSSGSWSPTRSTARTPSPRGAAGQAARRGGATCARSPTSRGSWVSARSCGSAAARSPPAGATSPRSSPTRSRPSSARSTSTAGWPRPTRSSTVSSTR